MIVVLEGEQYTFKTTIAEALQERGWQCIRPFRRGGENRTQFEQRVARARHIRVPANCFQEDIIVAEVLSNLNGNFVLDRSVPSGLAHSYIDIPTRGRAMELWLEALAAHGEYLVIEMLIDLMVDFRHKLSDRAEDYDWDKYDYVERGVLAGKISNAVRQVPSDRLIRFDATGVDGEAIVESILKQISDVSSRAEGVEAG